MPFRRRGRKFGRGRKRKFVKRRSVRKRGFTSSMHKITSNTLRTPVISDRTVMKLSAAIYGNMTITGGVGFIGVDLAGNGFEPPDTTLSTVVPPGLQQWAQLYHNYRILGSKLTLSAHYANGGSATGIVAMHFGILPWASEEYDGGATAFSFPAILSQPYGKRALIQAFQSTVAFGAGRVPRVSQYMSTKKMFGQRVTEADDYQGQFTSATVNSLVNTNPAEQWYWRVWAAPAIGGTGQSDVVIQVTGRITWYVRLEDRRMLEVPTIS